MANKKQTTPKPKQPETKPLSDGGSIAKEAMDMMMSFTPTDFGGKFENDLVEKADKIVKDSYSNWATATGNSDKIQSFTSYGFSNDTLNWPLWLALYNDSWVFRRAIDKPAQDMVNQGISIYGESEHDKIYRDLDRYKFDLIQLLQWGALFGGSVAVLLFDGISDDEMSQPINPIKIHGKRMRMYVTDRWYGVSTSTETVTNMKDIDFGTPVYYDISFADGHNVRVHHSYILRYEHRTAPKLIKTGQLQGWGYAEGAHILNELARDDQLKSAITSLVNKSLIEVIKMSGMRGVFMGADKGNEQQLRKRLEMVNWGRNFNSLTFLDKDDDYQTHELSNITGLSNLLETNMWLIAASLEMQGVLFGDMKGGLSQESDALKRYAITIHNRAESYFRPVMTKLLKVLYLANGITDPVEFDFNSLVKDEINNEKMSSINNYTQLLNSMRDAGVISKYQMAKSLQKFINEGVLDIDFSEDNLQCLEWQEKQEQIDIYKQRLQNEQMPNGINSLPSKLDYIKEISEQNSSSGEAEHTVTPDTKEENIDYENHEETTQTTEG